MTCALIFMGLVIDSMAEPVMLVMVVETNVVTKVVVEGLSVGTSSHIEDLTALLDTAIDLVLATPDVGPINLTGITVKASGRHDNERGHLNCSTDSAYHAGVCSRDRLTLMLWVVLLLLDLIRMRCR